MCGIAGTFTFADGRGDPAVIRRMCARLEHRGPDHEGIHVGPHIGLGERRLAVIDLSPEATAPLPSEDGSAWVVFNGEIYNFRALRQELLERGHTFRTATDTEVLVHLYEEYGDAMVHRLRGMFAFAIWDARRRRLFAARDRLGKKPFFYTHDAVRFAFASEIAALLEDPRVSRQPDPGALDAYLTLQYVPSPLSAFAGISKLPAGHTLACESDGTVRVQSYWAPPVVPPSDLPVAELEAELLNRLREAVRLRLVSDVPLGAFLSGGIDSSTVVALMAEASPQPVKTFSIGFNHAPANELPYARLVAERYGTEHHEFIVEPDALDVIPTLVRHYGEPFADSSAVPTYHVSRLARQHVTVALTGDGGDENFAGYDRYAEVLRWGAADRVPLAVRRLVAGGVRKALASAGPAGVAARVQRASSMMAGTLPARYRLHISMFKPQEKRALYTEAFRASVREGEPQEPAEAGAETMRWMMRHDLQHYLPDCLMVKCDIASMANSLEVRSPLLDHELVEFASALPGPLLRRGATGKLVLRDAVRPLLPQELFDRPKMGFGMPVSAWFRGSLSGFMESILLDDTSARRGLFRPAAVRAMVEQHASGRRDWSNRLWALLMLELWFREFID